MNQDRFDSFCEQVCAALDVQHPVALQTTGVTVAGQTVVVQHDEDFDFGMHVLMDIGTVTSAATRADVFGALLTLNLALPAEESLCFCLHEATSRLLLRGFVTEAEASVEGLVERILHWTGWVEELRAGPLAAVHRSDQDKDKHWLHEICA
jgi:hypothetical protein